MRPSPTREAIISSAAAAPMLTPTSCFLPSGTSARLVARSASSAAPGCREVLLEHVVGGHGDGGGSRVGAVPLRLPSGVVNRERGEREVERAEGWGAAPARCRPCGSRSAASPRRSRRRAGTGRIGAGRGDRAGERDGRGGRRAGRRPWPLGDGMAWQPPFGRCGLRRVSKGSAFADIRFSANIRDSAGGWPLGVSRRDATAVGATPGSETTWETRNDYLRLAAAGRTLGRVAPRERWAAEGTP